MITSHILETLSFDFLGAIFKPRRVSSRRNGGPTEKLRKYIHLYLESLKTRLFYGELYERAEKMESLRQVHMFNDPMTLVISFVDPEKHQLDFVLQRI